MFDLSVAEIGVICVVALLVLGPERLPKAARTLGFYARKARQSWFAVRSEFERELATEELKRSLKLDEVHATLKDTAEALQADAASAKAELELAAEQIRAAREGVSGADPLPVASDTTAQRDDGPADDGLSDEERARQGQALAEELPSDIEAADRLATRMPAQPIASHSGDAEASPTPQGSARMHRTHE